MESDAEAPAYSPISSMHSDGSDVVAKEGEGSDREDEFEGWMRDVLDVESAIDDIESEMDCNTAMEHTDSDTAVTTEEPLGITHSTGPAQQSWSGFKIVGDNWDKTVHASFQRSDDNRARSLHHFHLYAVKDRVDWSSLSDSQPPLPENIDFGSLLPSQSDIAAIKEEVAVLLSR